jgi:hypothetical protein
MICSILKFRFRKRSTRVQRGLRAWSVLRAFIAVQPNEPFFKTLYLKQSDIDNYM